MRPGVPRQPQQRPAAFCRFGGGLAGGGHGGGLHFGAGTELTEVRITQAESCRSAETFRLEAPRLALASLSAEAPLWVQMCPMF